MSTPLSYQSNAAEIPIIRKWLVRALILSVLLHLGLLVWFRTMELERFTVTSERLVPRAIEVRQLQIDPKLLEDEGNELPKPLQETPEVKPIDLPAENPAFDKIMDETRATPLAPTDLARPIVSEKPRVDANTVQTMARIQENTTRALEKELASQTDAIIKQAPSVNKESLLKLAQDTSRRAIIAGNSDAVGMAEASARIEKMIGTGVRKGDAPLSLPGGALFEFNRTEITDAAVQLLGRLAKLIRTNPNVTFRIEGYTDSFGDDAYNRQLSQTRADEVRRWLVQNMEVDPSKIETVGLGATAFKVQPDPRFDPRSAKFDRSLQQSDYDAEKVRQQPNRRVEIVFRFPRSQ